jgi:hypothetical protein
MKIFSVANALTGGMPEVSGDGQHAIEYHIVGDRLELRLELTSRTTMVLAW